MLAVIFDLLFGCRHKRVTRPITPVRVKFSAARQATYVACLDCGRRFEYDSANMRVGQPLRDVTADSMMSPVP